MLLLYKMIKPCGYIQRSCLIAFCAAFICTFIFCAGNNESVEKPVSGEGYSIDYVARKLVVTGQGASGKSESSIAQRKVKALFEARKNCITQAVSSLEEVVFSSEVALQNSRLQSSFSKVEISGYLRGIKQSEESTETLSDGSVIGTVIMTILFDGNQGLNNLLFNTMDESHAEEKTSDKGLKQTARLKNVTGIVIDVRSADFAPSMLPRVFSGTGDIVYSSGGVSREYAIEIGIAEFTRDMSGLSDRVGKNPELVNVKGLYLKDRSAVVVSDDTAKRLKELEDKFGLLSECRVAFLVK